MWPDLAIYWTLDNFFKSLATIDLPKSPTFLDNFCKGLKIYQYSSEIILGNFLDIWRFFSGHTAQISHVWFMQQLGFTFIERNHFSFTRDHLQPKRATRVWLGLPSLVLTCVPAFPYLFGTTKVWPILVAVKCLKNWWGQVWFKLVSVHSNNWGTYLPCAWPYLAKFRHFGNFLKLFGQFLKSFIFINNFLAYFGQKLLLGKF